VEITELADMDLIAKLIRVTKPAAIPVPGLTTRIGNEAEVRKAAEIRLSSSVH
jgi:hypothetical protein